MRKTLLIYTLAMGVIALFALTLSGCKSMQTKATNYFKQHQDELAELCSDKFPATPEYIPGEEKTTHDTVTRFVTSFDKGDTIITREVTIYKDRLRVDTFNRVDNAKIYALQTDKATLNAERNILTDQVKDLKSDVSKKMAWIVALGIAAGASIYMNIKNIFK